MPTIHDDEFGPITIRRSSLASHVRIRVAPDGTLRASLPLYAPMFMIKRLLKSSRRELRKLLAEQQLPQAYSSGGQIGKSHTLIVQPTSASLTVTRHGQQIIVRLPDALALSDSQVITEIRKIAQVALRIEAKNYLPRRLAYLAQQLGCHYEKVRFSHSSGRWGSCSSSGTISLNIALMKLPHELIDYVLIHELSHLKQMNHSQEFWQLVETGDPHYKEHRRLLKTHSPSV